MTTSSATSTGGRDESTVSASARSCRRNSPDAKPASTGPAHRRCSPGNGVYVVPPLPAPLATGDQLRLGQHLQMAHHRDPRNRKRGRDLSRSAGPTRNRSRMRRRVGSASVRQNDAVSASNCAVRHYILPARVQVTILAVSRSATGCGTDRPAT
jgi:hypothetical protein